MKKIALVLEGGAMRAMFTAGVLDILLEKHFSVDAMVTVSAGALFGVNYPSKQAGRALSYNLKYLSDKRYLSWYNFFTTGNIVNTEFAYHRIPLELDIFDNNTFKQSQIDFYATLTNVESGQAEYVKITDPVTQMDTLRASGSMPFVSKKVEIDGKFYLDGGIADSIPIEKCLQLGYEKIIVVLTQTAEYRKTPSNKWLIKCVYHSYPNLVTAMLNRWKNYNDCLEKISTLEKAGKIFVLRPSTDLHLSRIEKDRTKLQAMYDLGVEEINKNWQALQNYIEN
ncbi:patatin family protein [Pasteurella skyensis]|uniref:Patatin family protein n=1 Tax=Phocoenobacter skyensis TaxID=97481 RepID=A0AAJ6N7S2_9PAST|nr:patatin family protein [Pasteurella skyensis]MDP8161619.1 patatin family protein [Pasteurella skyensis]MDP8171775.1 patatin family protein [Pasteurella skyensis]MDP8176013.1 patatin family protein [Pasteurella skyensis]MDP8177981.1 patatin family protein [Pasteurella skyensis]MDP8182360.1 patatin family protein [Pasteurella skyensis]